MDLQVIADGQQAGKDPVSSAHPSIFPWFLQGWWLALIVQVLTCWQEWVGAVAWTWMILDIYCRSQTVIVFPSN